jgi:hypothetical protein
VAKKELEKEKQNEEGLGLWGKERSESHGIHFEKECVTVCHLRKEQVEVDGIGDVEEPEESDAQKSDAPEKIGERKGEKKMGLKVKRKTVGED